MVAARIMIVEDSITVASDLSDCLKSFGYIVTSMVASGEKAILKAQTEQPDLILMDIRLRDKIDGVEAAKQIHARFEIPVVFLSSYSDNDLLERAKQAGSFGYLIKPFEDRELYATLEMALYKAKVEKEYKQMQIRLQHDLKMKSIGALAGGIAHDFNNLLFVIIGNSELGLKSITECNILRDSLEEIKTAGLRASAIVKKLLEFSQNTHSKLKPIKVIPAIKDSLKFFRSTTLLSTIEVYENLPDADITMLSNPAQLNQVLMNLCINAFQAMEETGGTLTINAEILILSKEVIDDYPDLMTADNYFKIMIKDTGPGISHEIIDKIFDPYFTTKEPCDGSGMGLAVVLGIVKNHNGTILADNESGGGAVFTIILPLMDE